MSTPRFVLAVSMATMALTGTAIAKDGAGGRPLYASLPEGQSADTFALSRPKTIPAAEHAKGFHVEHPRHHYGKGSRGDSLPDYVAIYPSKAAADADHHHEDDLPTGQDAACLMTGTREGHRIEWHQSLQNYVNLTARIDHVPADELIQPVRSELLVSQPDGRAELQIRRAWIDPRTAGSRLISEETIPLRLVRTTMGLDIFAYRGDDSVTFITKLRAPRKEHQFISGMNVTTANGMTGSSTPRCHATVTLRVAPRVAEAAVFNGHAILPALPRARKKSKRDDRREFRVRPIALAFSTSWTSSDDAPVLSVSAGWAGRETTRQF